MRTLYLDCGMGAAGDMLTAALLELMPDKNDALAMLNSIGVPNVEYCMESVVKCGIKGTHICVKVFGEQEDEDMHSHHHHHHSSLHDIEHIISHFSGVSEKVKNDVMAVYGIIADAESKVHGVPVSDIHFHEVGTYDAVADITAVCLLMEKLSPEMVVASPVHVGSGQVKCAHGILPVPAPATAEILKGIPAYGGKINGELCTPTGAALLKYFVSVFGEMPVIATESIGYGMGKKDFEAANCVRAVLGTSQGSCDSIVELSFNVDDMTAEAVGFAMNCFFDEGAVEVYTVPVGMKKSRPGLMVCVMCKQADKEKIISSVFRHTTTIGIRENCSKRYTLSRSSVTVDSQFGKVRKKVSEGYGVVKEKYEYDDIARIAKEFDMSIADVLSKLD